MPLVKFKSNPFVPDQDNKRIIGRHGIHVYIDPAEIIEVSDALAYLSDDDVAPTIDGCIVVMSYDKSHHLAHPSEEVAKLANIHFKQLEDEEEKE